MWNSRFRFDYGITLEEDPDPGGSWVLGKYSVQIEEEAGSCVLENLEGTLHGVDIFSFGRPPSRVDDESPDPGELLRPAQGYDKSAQACPTAVGCCGPHQQMKRGVLHEVGIVRNAVYQFNARGGGQGGRGGFGRGFVKGRNGGNNAVYRRVDMNTKGPANSSGSQLMLLDQDTLNKKRAMENEVSTSSKEDSRDSKKEKALEETQNVDLAAAAEQPRQDK